MTNQLRLCALLGALAVGIGAFGAHGLKAIVAPEQLETFGTAVRYHFYHVFAIGLAVALSALPGIDHKRLRQAVFSWAIGILLFSGSLYLLSLKTVIGFPVAFLGPVTPIGGLFFIIGWVLLLLAARRNLGTDA
ncbi:MAG: uncharacterized membrane protein YgdD (TMEM256/DUF423 family) [Neolewinella sp.]|jgi:uncharacterized membrane protein YgdD (TMEM256/DUF423 family)